VSEAAEGRARGRGLRLPDRLDPLLVRELQQALGGRVFPGMLVLSLLCMLVLVVAVLGDRGATLTRGRDAFQGVLIILSLLVCGVVPFQAYFATRQESVGESAEALMLTRLTPWAIVRGKLTAAHAQMLLWMSLAAPLLALTWLLRGVSVTQIALGLLLAMLGSVVISALAVAAGTLARFERMSTLAVLAGLAVVTAAAFGWTSFMVAVSTGGNWFGTEELVYLLVTAVPSMAFAVLVARSQFTHPFENRSTHFRVLLPAALLAASAALPWVLRRHDLFLLPFAGAIGLAAFLVFAATEEDALSPWLALRVPRSPLRAALAAPLLPGGARGLLWGLSVAALLWAAVHATLDPGVRGRVLYTSDPTGGSSLQAARAAVLVLTYAIFYGALGAVLRPRLRAGTAGNWIARLLVFGILVTMSVVPMLIQFLLGELRSWTPLQIFNPFWTILDAMEQPLLRGSAFPLLLAFTGLLLLALRGRLVRAVSDVTAASAARRAREGGAAVP
jgi:hypothetical protein